MIEDQSGSWAQQGLPEEGERTLTVVLPRSLNQRLSESAHKADETSNYHIVTLLQSKVNACKVDSPGVNGPFTAWLSGLEFGPTGRDEEVIHLRLTLPENLYLALEKAAERSLDKKSCQPHHKRFHLILGAALEELEPVVAAKPLKPRKKGPSEKPAAGKNVAVERKSG